MTLPQAESKIPSAIGDLSIVLTDYIENQAEEDETPVYKTARFEVQVLDADGAVMRLINGDLVPHLTQGQIDGLLGFVDTLRAKAESEILP